jgi:putative transposase
MKRLYPSDLTDFEWEVVKDLIPPSKKGGGKRRADIRQILNACFYLTKTGCQWRMLPHEYPPWGTIYWYFAVWKKDGTFEKIHDKLVKIVRAQQGKKTISYRRNTR